MRRESENGVRSPSPYGITDGTVRDNQTVYESVENIWSRGRNLIIHCITAGLKIALRTYISADKFSRGPLRAYRRALSYDKVFRDIIIILQIFHAYRIECDIICSAVRGPKRPFNQIRFHGRNERYRTNSIISIFALMTSARATLLSDSVNSTSCSDVAISRISQLNRGRAPTYQRTVGRSIKNNSAENYLQLFRSGRNNGVTRRAPRILRAELCCGSRFVVYTGDFERRDTPPILGTPRNKSLLVKRPLNAY